MKLRCSYYHLLCFSFICDLYVLIRTWKVIKDNINILFHFHLWKKPTLMRLFLMLCTIKGLVTCIYIVLKVHCLKGSFVKLKWDHSLNFNEYQIKNFLYWKFSHYISIYFHLPNIHVYWIVNIIIRIVTVLARISCRTVALRKNFFVDRPVCQQNFFFRRATVLQLSKNDSKTFLAIAIRWKVKLSHHCLNRIQRRPSLLTFRR